MIELSKMMIDGAKQYEVEEIADTLAKSFDLIFTPY